MTKKLSDCYSLLMIFQTEMSDSDIHRIIHAYFNGVKCIIFTQNYEKVEVLYHELQIEMRKRHILKEKDELKFGVSSEQVQKANRRREQLRQFNFECYYVTEIPYEEKMVVIYDGEMTMQQEELLKRLSGLCSFNYEQYSIEHANSKKNILVKAGAGTGKTYSMVSRIAYLCNTSEGNIENIVDEIAMVTFTNEAADNMKKRLKNLFQNYFILTGDKKYLKMIEDVEQMAIATIHKFAKTILKSVCMEMGLGYDFSIVSGDYVKELCYEKHLTEYLKRKEKVNPNVYKDLKIPIDYYNSNATQFYSTTVSVDMTEANEKFLSKLTPTVPHILDLGCGSGRDSLYFLEHGYQVTSIDGSTEMCRKATALTGQQVICRRFEDIDYQNQFDGIWACASILHVPKAELPSMFQNLTTALKPNGILYVSFKYGDFEGERKGRYFTDLTEETLASLIAPIENLKQLESFITTDVRPGRQDEKWLNVILQKQI